MISVALAPSVVQAPPAADLSSFIGSAAEAALGRMPMQVVPQTVGNAKPDQQRNSPQPSPQTIEQPASPAATGSKFEALINAGKGEIKLPTPFSTTFIAQLFGQVSDTPEGTGVTAIWLGNKGKAPETTADMDFERIEQTTGQVKYAPSGARMVSGTASATQEAFAQEAQLKYAPSGAKPASSGSTAMAEWRAQQVLAAPFRRAAGKESANSVFSPGLTAYSSTQSRALFMAAFKSLEFNARL